MLISNSMEETEEIGKEIGKEIDKKINKDKALKQDSKKIQVLALFGGMGMGKTAITRGIAEYFGVRDQVCSPTFAIVNEYRGKKCDIYHFDMYRVHTEEDLESTGFYDYLDKGVIIIEWSENIKKFLPKGAITICIEQGKDENQRKIQIEGIEI